MICAIPRYDCVAAQNYNFYNLKARCHNVTMSRYDCIGAQNYNFYNRKAMHHNVEMFLIKEI